MQQKKNLSTDALRHAISFSCEAARVRSDSSLPLKISCPSRRESGDCPAEHVYEDGEGEMRNSGMT